MTGLKSARAKLAQKQVNRAPMSLRFIGLFSVAMLLHGLADYTVSGGFEVNAKRGIFCLIHTEQATL